MQLFRHAEGRLCKALDVTVAQQKIMNSQQFLSHTDYCLMVSRITEDILREIYLRGKGAQHSGCTESHVPTGQGGSAYHYVIQARLQRTDKSGNSGCHCSGTNVHRSRQLLFWPGQTYLCVLSALHKDRIWQAESKFTFVLCCSWNRKKSSLWLWHFEWNIICHAVMEGTHFNISGRDHLMSQ